LNRFFHKITVLILIQALLCPHLALANDDAKKSTLSPSLSMSLPMFQKTFFQTLDDKRIIIIHLPGLSFAKTKKELRSLRNILKSKTAFNADRKGFLWWGVGFLTAAVGLPLFKQINQLAAVAAYGGQEKFEKDMVKLLLNASVYSPNDYAVFKKSLLYFQTWGHYLNIPEHMAKKQ